MEYAQAILAFLHASERDGWSHIVTSDESRLFLNISPGCIWSLERWQSHKAAIWYSEQIIHVHGHMESEPLLCYPQTPKQWQNERRLFCEKHTHSIWISDLSSRKGAVWEMTYDASPQLVSSQKSDFNRLVRRTWHGQHTMSIRPTCLIWLPVTSTYFLQWKKNSTRDLCLAKSGI
jgi:hypothetical protein